MLSLDGEETVKRAWYKVCSDAVLERFNKV